MADTAHVASFAYVPAPIIGVSPTNSIYKKQSNYKVIPRVYRESIRRELERERERNNAISFQFLGYNNFLMNFSFFNYI